MLTGGGPGPSQASCRLITRSLAARAAAAVGLGEAAVAVIAVLAAGAGQLVVAPRLLPLHRAHSCSWGLLTTSWRLLPHSWCLLTASWRLLQTGLLLLDCRSSCGRGVR